MATAPSLGFPQAVVRNGWRERRIIVKSWERGEKGVQGGVCILLMDVGVAQVLLQSLLAAKGQHTMRGTRNVDPCAVAVDAMYPAMLPCREPISDFATPSLVHPLID